MRVTAEVTPHHLTMTDEMVDPTDSSTKVNPPLRGQADVNAALEGLKDGTIDIIATDHSPHAQEEKIVNINSLQVGSQVLKLHLAYY